MRFISLAYIIMLFRITFNLFIMLGFFPVIGVKRKLVLQQCWVELFFRALIFELQFFKLFRPSCVIFFMLQYSLLDFTESIFSFFTSPFLVTINLTFLFIKQIVIFLLWNVDEFVWLKCENKVFRFEKVFVDAPSTLRIFLFY